jgi:hypothetical protein
MKIVIVAGLVVASTMALSACGKHDDTANPPDTVPGAAATAYPPAAPAPAPMPPATASTAPTYPPPATTAGMDNVPPTARTRP